MTNREKLRKKYIAKIDDDFLFNTFCDEFPNCEGCAFNCYLFGCKNVFKAWLNEEAKEEEK